MNPKAEALGWGKEKLAWPPSWRHTGFIVNLCHLGLLTSMRFLPSPNLRMSFITFSTEGHTVMQLTSDR